MPDIHLAAEDARFIEEQVEAGIYQNADEVIAVALRLLGSREGRLQELRDLIQEGLDDVEAGRVMSFANEGELTAYIMAMGEEADEAKTSGDDRKGIARSSRSL